MKQVGHFFILLILISPLIVACKAGTPTATDMKIVVDQTRRATPTTIKTLTRAPELIVENGEELLIPTFTIIPLLPTEAPTATPPTPAPTPTVIYPLYTGPPLNRYNAGIQIHLHQEDPDSLIAHLKNLGIGWVKTQISWKLFQPEPDRFDDFLWAELDRLIAASEKEGIQVMLSVAKAPEWSRSTTELDGPPSDFSTFQVFMEFLANRYKGRVSAYELWNEPNLKREWNGSPLSAGKLVELVGAGAAGVRQADPESILISGAPATTGINDGVNAIDDRIFLRQMVSAGITEIVDGIGAHPYGWANPPGSRVNNPDPAIPSHNNHPSFFFADTLEDYRKILEEAGQTDTKIWVTEFGWGSYDGLGIQPPEEVAYMAHVDEQQQAHYTLQAYEAAHDIEWLGPLILWNLNFAPTLGPEFTVSAYSALRPDGSPRPLYYALSAIPWVDGPSQGYGP